MKGLREAAILLLVAAVPAVLALALHPGLADRRHAGLEPDAVLLEDVRDAPEDVLWVDARSDEAFAAGSIPEAIHLAPDRFDSDLGAVLAAWHPGMKVVVFCSSLSCSTSKAVAERLRQAGLEEVHFLHGGWEAWVKAAKP